MPKCSRQKQCVAMEKYCNFDDKYRGIHTIEPIDLGTMKYTGEIYYYYQTHKADREIVLNYCPWCGSDLRKFNKKKAGNQ